MEPAKDKRGRTSDELDDILREADQSRRGGKSDLGDILYDREPSRAERPRQLKVVAGGTSVAPGSVTPDVPPEIKYEAEEFHLAEPSDHRLRPLIVIAPATYLVIALGVMAVFLWLRFPSGLPLVKESQVPEVYSEASVRWGLVLTSQRIDHFYREEGRMPWGFQEIGPRASELISYDRVSDDHYRLTAPGPTGPLTLDSQTSRAAFLGNSLSALRKTAEARP